MKKICKNCKNKFEGHSERKFCGRVCSNEYNGIHIFRGRKNTWKHKTSKTILKMYNSGKVFGWKSVDMENRPVNKGDQCYQWKGGVSFNYGLNYANDLINLITLCHSCHTTITNKILKVYHNWTIPREDLGNQEPVTTIRWTPKLGEDIVWTTKQFVDVNRNVLQLLI